MAPKQTEPLMGASFIFVVYMKPRAKFQDIIKFCQSDGSNDVNKPRCHNGIYFKWSPA